jgi:hypothetical protein
LHLTSADLHLVSLGPFPNSGNPFRLTLRRAAGPAASRFSTSPTRAGDEENLAENPPDLHERPAEVSLQEVSADSASTNPGNSGAGDTRVRVEDRVDLVSCLVRGGGRVVREKPDHQAASACTHGSGLPTRRDDVSAGGMVRRSAEGSGLESPAGSHDAAARGCSGGRSDRARARDGAW